MNRVGKIALVSALALSAPATAAPVMMHAPMTPQLAPMPQNADAVAERIRLRLSPRGLAWARMESARLHAGQIAPENVEADARRAGGGMFGAGLPPGADIEELAFFVLMQASKDADQDLRDIMGQTKALGNSKQGQRATINPLNRSGQRLQNRKESTNDLSDMQSLRLQTAMDRRTKYMQTMSNIMKKIEETDDSIVKHMK